MEQRSGCRTNADRYADQDFCWRDRVTAAGAVIDANSPPYSLVFHVPAIGKAMGTSKAIAITWLYGDEEHKETEPMGYGVPRSISCRSGSKAQSGLEPATDCEPVGDVGVVGWDRTADRPSTWIS
jgi:hypothetical protein